ncbi:MAG: rhodanese-like domain-containing protein [Candidatus Thiodiazotropha taylori]|nr:rhodanese-like domain-containing protein [Candidatus Thiodiazotropha taylori]MCG8042527.1 rhodanese-like domain-containing protein [Candidatus Thiodiazotropha taylori]MCG8108987.1 rhodanese-like domain-containing protein [Candidatus Thiodiazotropha taylori]MCG8109449.1 rhodanese-like domain-containing protein [Candidatus Thiodiazotropha taylori]MCW4281323.1 rhodanese-like domain-containing protein [Candidatus Thiodiazotropha taylori]
MNITPQVDEFEVKHQGKVITIRRNQDTEAMLEFDFARTSRPCPPFCAQPMKVADGIETIGEVELIAFLQNQLAEQQGLLIDARTEDWHERGTIPGSINIPFTHLNPAQGADEFTLEESLQRLGARIVDGEWDFSQAKQLVIWCNGPWCGQSPTAIKGLIGIGYPKQKLLYYRGGMQLWRIYGLPVVSPDGDLLDE